MNYFSLRLYKESLKQSRAVAIVLMVITAVITSIVPLVMLIEYRRSADTDIDFLNVNSLVTGLGFIAIIVPAILAIRVFGFLFKRSSSDFFHALPYTRQCLYISHFLAAFTWALATLAVAIGLPTLFYGINSHVLFKPQFVLYNFIVGLVVMLFVFGAMLISVSIMGKGLLALELAAFIIFLPKVIMLLGTETVASKLLNIIIINYLPFFSVRYNLPIIMLLGSTMDPSGYINAFSYLPGILTSLAVAIVYLVLGGILFCIRRSEFAENAAPNRKLQAVLRVVYSLIFFLLAVSLIILEEDAGSITVFLCIGVLVYLGYELITTRKIKNVLKSLPGLIVVAVLCVVYAFTIKISESVILNDVPEAGDIESIEVVNDDIDWYWYGEAVDYNEMLQSKIVVKDKEINSIVAKAYADTTERIKSGEGMDYRNSTYLLIKINERNGSKVRNIFIDYTDYEKLTELLLKQPEYHDATFAIPEDAVVTSFATKEYNENVWKQFIAEYNILSDDEKLKVLEGRDYYYEYWDDDYNSGEQYVYMQAHGYYGTTLYSKNYRIVNTLMPKTYDLYLEYQYKENISKLKKVYDIMNNGAPGDGYANVWFNNAQTKDYYIEGFDMYIYYDDNGNFTDAMLSGSWSKNTDRYEKHYYDEVATDGDADYSEDYYYADNWKSVNLNEEEAKTLSEMFIRAFDSDNKADMSKPHQDVLASYYIYSGDRYTSTNVTLNINEDAFNEFAEYLIKNY